MTSFVAPNTNPGIFVVAWYEGDMDWTLHPIHGWRFDLPEHPWEEHPPAIPLVSVELPQRWLIHDVNTRRSWIPGDVEFADVGDARYYLRAMRQAA